MSFILKNLKEFNLNNFIKNNQIKTKKKKRAHIRRFFYNSYAIYNNA